MDQIAALVKKRPLFEDMRPAIRPHAAIPVNDFIYYSPGTSNANMVVCKDARVIINTGMGFEAILTHKPTFDKTCSAPTHTIISTQGHVDHVGGVCHFREDGTRYIAQANNHSCQHDDALIKRRRETQADIWFNNTLEAAIEVAKTRPDLLVQDIPKPDLVFDDRFTFEVGEVAFELLAVPGGETIDSCAVWLPQHRIVFTGNQFGPLFPHFPNFNTIRGDKYRWVEPYLKSLTRIMQLKPNMLITGHFEPILGEDLIQQCLQRLHDAVSYVFEETMRAMAEGKDVFTMMREIQLPESLQLGQNYGKVSWAIRTLWESHMGWFKAQHSSELYATPPHTAMADLVALTNIQSVLKRAAALLDTGYTERALLLVEACLEHDAQSIDALNLAVKVHETLLEGTAANNFWEAGWLRHRLAALKKQRAT